MTDAAQKETHGFQAEVKQLLQLMVNSLYSNKEIFLRELVSNASDAADKFRYQAMLDSALYEKNEQDNNLEIHLSFDKEARTITIADNGIGMTHDDVIENLGTIAKSGTREFFDSLSGDQTKDAQLIGQFGVGFYSAFIVADSVTVVSRRAGKPADTGVCWISKGDGEFTVHAVNKPTRGTEVVLHLKEGEDEFLEHSRLRHIITKYADHISFPVIMEKLPEPDLASEDADADDADAKKAETPAEIEYETVNRATALWTRSKQEISDEEYQEFYKHIAHDHEEPLLWAHNRVEGKLEYTLLFYIPKRAPFDLWNRDAKHGLKLYVQRVFIMDDADQFLPSYLRFVRGIVDTKDLSLNVSREILQNNRVVESMRSGLVKKILDALIKLADKEPEKYATFWENFGQVLKEGPAEDAGNREKIAKLLRFTTTQSDGTKQDVSLADYVSRMGEKQEKIYYITADSYAAAKNSPHLELFQQKGIEVILLFDQVDEWLASHLNEFEGKPLQSVARGAVDLDAADDEDKEKQKAEQEEQDKVFKPLTEKTQEVLGERVKSVRMTHRLTESPACLVADDYDMGLQMQRILQAAGQNFPASKPILELNPEHSLIKKLQAGMADEDFSEWAQLIFEQALLAEGGHLDDPATFVKRLNRLLLEPSL